jgi:flagellar motor protein MotB
MAPERIDAMGHSDSRPIATNSTSEGRQKNRRVEIVVKH